MFFLDFESLSLWLNLVIFLLIAAAIWLAGTRLSVYADLIAERTGMSRAFIGLLLLAGATSLPELGRTVTAAAIGDAPLAIDSLFGGIVLQTAILAIADVSIGAGALTFITPRPVLLLEGALLVILIAIALAGIAAGELLSLFGVGLWSALLLVAYILVLYMLRHYESREQWQPMEVPVMPSSIARQLMYERYQDRSIKRVVLYFVLAALVVLVAGVTLAPVGEVLAGQTGLGSGFVGATLLAAATSLPELTTTLAAVRLGAYSMAISNIFGSNALLIALVFVADVFYDSTERLTASIP